MVEKNRKGDFMGSGRGAEERCIFCKYTQRQGDGTYACEKGEGFIGNNKAEVSNNWEPPCGGYEFEHWSNDEGSKSLENPNII